MDGRRRTRTSLISALPFAHVCGQQPDELVLCDRADGQGWRVVVPVERWRRS